MATIPRIFSASKLLAQPIQAYVRQDTLRRWAELNPVLRLDELAYETNSNVFRLGDGKTPYLDLPAYALSHYEYPLLSPVDRIFEQIDVLHSNLSWLEKAVSKLTKEED